jgi:hypothetical protein
VPVPDAHREALRLAEEPFRAAEVQRHPVPAEHHGHEVRGAGQSHRLGRRDDVPGVQSSRTHLGAKLVEVERDHHGGGAPAVPRQHLRGQRLQQRTERAPEQHRVRDPLPGVWVGAVEPGVQMPAPRSSEGIQVGLQPPGNRV